MKRVDNFAKFLLDTGLLSEINRLVLHKFGYVMTIDTSFTDRRKVSISGIFEPDEECDEGWLFDPESWENYQNKFEAFLEKEGQDKLDRRKSKLGFEIQETIIEEI